MTDFVYVIKYSGETLFGGSTGSGMGVEAIQRENTQKTYILTHGSITAGNTASLELENTNTDYQTTAAAKVILMITGSATTVTDFEIMEHTVADSGAGNQLEDFPAVSLSATLRITSKVLTIPAGSYVNIKATTGNIGSVIGVLVE